MRSNRPTASYVDVAPSLRKSAAIAAYVIGVVMQKIKHFDGWVVLSNVMLDYIDQTALPPNAFSLSLPTLM
eukprot:jgi/Tetstr1/430249/TSEL_020077.t1